MRRRALFVALGAVLVAAVWAALEARPTPPVAPGTIVATIETVVLGDVGADPAAPEAAARTIEPYRGLGVWVDSFDYSPDYSAGEPGLAPGAAEEMAANGAATLFLQAARLDERSPDVLEDRWLLAEWLLRAHAADMEVVGWFLPMWLDDGTELEHLLAITELEVLGHRFDGVAVDIEWNQDGLEPQERSRRLVELSNQLRAATGEDALGAIVMPPALLEVVNPNFWPEFPWTELADLYDVWLPMSYWSFRSNESGFGDGYAYNTESTERLRNNLDDPTAVVHAIGGIGAVDQTDEERLGGSEPLAHVDDVVLFLQSLADTNAIGGSVYDWQTTDEVGRSTMAELFGGLYGSPGE